MVTFDAAEPGTSREHWDEDPRLPRLATLDLRPFESVLVIAAHPDDETLGAGGLIAEAVALGLDVTVVIVTDGAAAAAVSPDSAATPNAAAAAAGAAARGLVRAREVTAAVAALGASRPPVLLGHPDGGIREERGPVRSSLDAVVAELGGSPLLVSTWVGDGHRDHRILAEVVAELAAERGLTHWQYPIWMWHWGGLRDPRIPWDAFGSLALGSSARSAKTAALGAFPSQTIGRGGRPPMLQARFLAHFARPFEVFVV